MKEAKTGCSTSCSIKDRAMLSDSSVYLCVALYKDTQGGAK